MSSNDANKRKRKPTAIPETVSNNDDQNPKERKARRVSTSNALASSTVALRVDTPAMTEDAVAANALSTATEDEEPIQSVGKIIQDLFHTDNAKINAALAALNLDFIKDKKISLSELENILNDLKKP